MALLNFKYGAQATLPVLDHTTEAGQARIGNVYITTDTKRMFIDLPDQSELVSLSDFITASSLEALNNLDTRFKNTGTLYLVIDGDSTTMYRYDGKFIAISDTVEVSKIQAAITAAQTTADEAKSAASAAQSTADQAVSNAATAQAAAEAAQSTADQGVTKAAAAQSTADQAVSAAAEAQADADAAQSAADAAQSTANTAVTNAATAQSTADTAVTNAAAAQKTANTAVTNAATAQSAAEAAQTTANNAASTASANSTAISNLETDLNTTNNNVTSVTNRVATIEGAYVNKDGSVAMANALKMGSNKITGLFDGEVATDAATYGQLSNLQTALEKADSDLDSAIDSLTTVVNAKADSATINQTIADLEAAYKDADEDLQDAIDNLGTTKADKTTVETLTQTVSNNKSAVDSEIATIKTTLGTKADSSTVTSLQTTLEAADKTLQANIDKKADATTVTAQINALDEAYKAADSSLQSAIDTINTKLVDLNTVMNFRGVVTEFSEISEPAVGDVVVKGNKEYVCVEPEASSDDDKWAEIGDVTAEAAAISELQASVGTRPNTTDNLWAYVQSLRTDLGTKGSNESNAFSRISALESWQGTHETEYSNLEGRVDTNDTDIERILLTLSWGTF